MLVVYAALYYSRRQVAGRTQFSIMSMYPELVNVIQTVLPSGMASSDCTHLIWFAGTPWQHMMYNVNMHKQVGQEQATPQCWLRRGHHNTTVVKMAQISGSRHHIPQVQVAKLHLGNWSGSSP